MTGTLHKSKDKWIVTYGSSFTNYEVWPIDVPLHPDDVAAIEDQTLVFDNVEGRIAAFNPVEFDIIKEGLIKYAKLKNQ